MQWQAWPVPDPAPTEVRLRHTAIGVDFADTYHRKGVSRPCGGGSRDYPARNLLHLPDVCSIASFGYNHGESSTE
ncbi:MAG: hypothetical protein AB8C46_04005 [Burkholderiaceae bacterium]